MTKYDHVIAMARSEVGIDAANYGDAQIMKKYFQEQVALGKFKMATPRTCSSWWWRSTLPW